MLASIKHQRDTSDTPATMQALRSNTVQNCTQFPGDWECTGFEERHPLISPGSFSHTPHGAHLTSALSFVVQLWRIAHSGLEETLQNTNCSGVSLSAQEKKWQDERKQPQAALGSRGRRGLDWILEKNLHWKGWQTFLSLSHLRRPIQPSFRSQV